MTFRNAINFLNDRRGTIAPIFALSLIPTVGAIGTAVDYTRANSTRVAMQAALDATTLAMAGTAASVNEDALKTNATAYFNALFHKPGTSGVTLTVNYTKEGGSKLVMTGSANVKTQFMNIPGFGISHIPILASSTTTWGNTRLRVALALDNTGSMSSSGKMDALKTASKNLLDQLKTAATNNGDVYVSIIPFAVDVNVGNTNKDASWLKWEDWEKTNGSCSKKDYKNRSDCVSNGRTWTVADRSTWNGCVTDRDKPYDTNNVPPSDASGGVSRFPTDQASNCPVALMPLSYDWAALKTKIDDMKPTGNTNTTIGLEWAWHSLAQGTPLYAPPEEEKYIYKKVIIFLTDGENTQNRWDTSSSKIDARMKIACQNAKDDNVTIYTILVMAGSESLLKECSSGPNNYYFKITKADQMVDVFNQIGTQISRLHVAR